MDSTLAAYLNMAIGIVGIVLTALSAPTFLQLTASVGGGGKEEIEPLGRAVRIGGLLLLLVTFAFLLALGIALALLPFSRSLGAASPVLTSVLTVAFLYCSAFTGALAHFRSPWAIPGIVGTTFIAVLAMIAGIDGKGGAFAGAGVFGLAVFLLTGLFTTLVAGGAFSEPTAP